MIMKRIGPILLIIIGLVLIIDELWMFGIPSEPILPDMSEYHVEPFHHWMLGAVMLVCGLYLVRTGR